MSLTEILGNTPRGPAPLPDGTRYAFKPSVMGGARLYELTDDNALAWRSGSKSGAWPLDTITAIRLSYRPLSVQARRFRADIENAQGGRLTAYSATWHSIVKVSPQDTDYRAFIVELHRRLNDIQSRAVLVAGIPQILYFAGVAMMSLVGVAILALLVRALSLGQYAGALFLLGFSAMAVWQLGGFMKRNRPRSYTFDALPEDVLP